MSDYREVHHDEAEEARKIAARFPTIDIHSTGTTLVHIQKEAVTDSILQPGWYQVSRGLVLHWTNKNDVLREIGQLVRTD